MEEFHCAATMDDDQEGEWREILQKWEEQELTPAHSHDDHANIGLMGGVSQQLIIPTCTPPLLTSLAMDSFLPPNPNALPPSLAHSLIHSPHSFIPTSIHQLHTNPVISLDSAAIDHSDNLISTVRQQDESTDISKFSWFSDYLQSMQSHPVPPSSSSYNNLLNIGGGNQRGSVAAAQSLYSNQEGLDEMMEQMNNDFINYGGVGSLQEQLSNALCASEMMISTRPQLIKESERVLGSGNEGASAQTLLFSPASSVSSDGGPEDDSDSHEDMKDSLDMANSLNAFDDLIMPAGEHSHLSIPSSLPSSDTLSSKATTKLQGETSAAPSSSHDQDKKRASKSARVTKKPKRERGAKLAIKIQSDVEVLDDGYKWRKYGQKAVKNSPFPRSYYKCTDKQCKVKKHVERQAHEPDYVVTTYEGVHNHSRPDQQVQVLHSQGDIATQQHDSFQAFVPTPSTHHVSPMELFGIRPSSLFQQADSQPMSLPLQQATSSTQHTLEAIDQDALQNLLHGEPRRSS